VMEIVAPKIGGVQSADGTHIAAHHMIDGGPSVLFDAVAVLVSDEGAEMLQTEATARDFVADAFAHCKFIAISPQAAKLLLHSGIDPQAEGVVTLDTKGAARGFVETCRKLRLWSRETAVKL
jgi:catalase